MPLSAHNGLQKDDCAQSIERSTRSESIDKSSHRTSVFTEHHELPPVWGKDSQPGYKGKRVLGILPDIHPDGPYANSGPLGAYDPRYNEPVRMARPLDVGYEMPERYGGKEVAWKEEGVIPLAGNNNTWVPPVIQERRVCGVVRWAFWAVFACICFLIIGGAIGGVIAGITSSKKSASNASSSGSANQGLAATTSYSTSMSSATSTSTMSNGEVVLITQVLTAVQTIKPQTTANSQATSETATTKSSSSTPTSTSTSSSHNATSAATTLPQGPSTTVSTAASSTSTQSSSTQVYPLDCPAINGNTVSTTAGTQTSTYLISCNTSFSSSPINTVTATSLLECFNACAQYTLLSTSTCRAATFNSRLAAGNCLLRSDVSSQMSTGSDEGVATAVLQDGKKGRKRGRWFHGVVGVM